MTDCFHCGEDDHLSYDCPNRTHRRRAPAAPWPTAGAESTGRPQPPRGLPAVEHARPVPAGTPGPGCPTSLRLIKGWSAGQRRDKRRELAAEQAAESRASRWA